MRKDKKYILVPVDFLEPSKRAAAYAVKLAKRLNAEVYLLNIIEAPGLLSKFFESGNLLVKVTDMAKDQLQEMIRDLSGIDPDVKLHSRVDRGKRYERILQMAREIVVPMDLTQVNRKQIYSALVYGLNYGAKIHLVSSLIPGVRVKQSLIYKKMRDAKRTLEQNGVNTEIHILEKDKRPSYERVLRYSEEIDAGMILIMTHREGYNYDNYIGAFAHHLINRSTIPVLSLTASATDFNFKEVIKTVVDPVGIFFKK
jgi:nucleotide-binding universal stress UspA family protein